ncbi:MAG: hypothetical protein GY946_00125 [bacterium]|nr:hypothetical protein [bacterium]
MRHASSILITLTLLLCSSIQAQCGFDETRIRCRTGNQVVTGPIWGEIRFTCTGYLDDEVLIFNNWGISVVQGTIRSLRSNPSVRAVVTHSGGQTSLRFSFWFRPDLNNGNVYIQRNGTCVDQDHIKLR